MHQFLPCVYLFSSADFLVPVTQWYLSHTLSGVRWKGVFEHRQALPRNSGSVEQAGADLAHYAFKYILSGCTGETHY